MLSNSEKREYREWLDLCERIKHATAPIKDENPEAKASRIKTLLDDFEAFCKYYFPHYTESPFGWFHKKAAKKIQKDKNIFCVLEWPREHAKSVVAAVLIPMWLKARGEFSGMVVGSSNKDKADGLLGDIQAELMSNQKYASDFGEQYRIGDWQSGNFSTADGSGFWAFGRGQSPRGVRKAEKRPNYGLIDDIDDKEIVKNPKRVQEAVDWILEDFMGCFSIKGSRMVIAGNRIHKNSILANIVGDVEEGDPKRDKIEHIKVYATEGKKHEFVGVGMGEPAWKERYTIEELSGRFDKTGYPGTAREYYHIHMEKGLVWKTDDINWKPRLKLKDYDMIISYCDPSFKDGKKSDTKAVVAVGRKGKEYHILKAFVRVAPINEMCNAHYSIAEWLGDSAPKHYMEANFIQDTHLKDYEMEGELRGYQLNVRADKRNKPDKTGRIENLYPLFSRKWFFFAEEERQDRDMQALVQQFLLFPEGKDDGPDAVEGAYYLLTYKHRRKGDSVVRMGKSSRKYR